MPAAVAVAASGGRDSTALLHVTARAARELGLRVHALHVHHGLCADADRWLARLRAQCARWARSGLPLAFHASRLGTRPAAGESVEAWARRERYRALRAMALDAGCGLVLLAHHRRDQAETLLLQALRGGGPAGLAAMPRLAQRDGIVWARPWLGIEREAIEAYVARHRLTFVDDASNDDDRFARNRLRRRVWPALIAAFPDAEAQLAAAAARAAQSAAALAERAAIDLGPGDGSGLDVASWATLGEARRANAAAAWLRRAGVAPSSSLVLRLARELVPNGGGHWPLPAGELREHRGRLLLVTARTAAPSMAIRVDLSRPTIVEVPEWHGRFVVTEAGEGGIAATRLRRATLRARAGGETFQRAPRSTPRRLKKQFQSLAVAAWDRDGPLVWDGDELLFVPGLGIDARAVAAPGEPQCGLRWEPLPPG